METKPGRLEVTLTLGLLLGIVYAFIAALLLACAGCQPTEEYIYPRRALALNHAHRAPDSVLTRYAVVYGLQEATKMAAKRAGLTGRQNKALRVFATIQPTVTYEHVPAVWEYSLAPYNLTEALHVATYENLIRGCDWFLRDAEGNTLGKWTDDNPWRALNLTDYCPRGVYGDTRGLTCLDWLCGPGLDVLSNDVSGDAFDGYVLEDGPDRHLWCWNWDGCVQLGDRCVNEYGYRAAADSCRQRLLDEFVLEAGRRGFLMLTNGHWVLPSCPSYDPPMWDAFSGCKLERLGDWGGCPYDDLARWWEVYRGVENLYGPVKARKRYDSVQGWDVSLLQLELAGPASDEDMRHLRLHAGLCLMGNSTFSVSRYHNHHGGEPEDIPPELNQPLGVACGPYQETPDGLIYREFERTEEVTRGVLRKVRRRVTVNITEHAIGKVPARDATWEVVEQ